MCVHILFFQEVVVVTAAFYVSQFLMLCIRHPEKVYHGRPLRELLRVTLFFLDTV